METERAPAWAAQIEYAEAFGCHPQDVGRTVKARWWHRWLVYGQARSARQAWEHFYNAKDAVTELSKAEHRAKNWALDQDG